MTQFIFVADPNSFDGANRFYYFLSEPEMVHFEILNINGKSIALLEEGRQQAGHHFICWSTSGLGDGIYLVRIQAGSESVTHNLSVIKQENITQ